jgi:predicted DNA-binding ribbon-helix-helix protein
MKSPIIKRSIAVAGHKTSVSLEDEFWKALKEMAIQRDVKLSDIIAVIDGERQCGNLSSAIRVFVLGSYRDQISEHENHGRGREIFSNASSPIAPTEGH